jgi:uncharacterized protein YbaR (Trm112 family)
VRLSDFVWCPRCEASLDEAPGTFECSGCRRKYPSIGGIPVLVPEPDELIAEWRALVRSFERDMRVGLDELLAQITTWELEQCTRTRLETLYDHLGRHRTRLVELLASAGLAGESSSARRSVDAMFQQSSLVEHYAQIHRDWGWDDGERGEAFEATAEVSEIIGDRKLGKFLILGAGACRLTQDLHHRHHATATLALDVDPLPFVVARRNLSGESVRLYEFPPWPLDSKRLFADRTLSSRLPVDPTLRLIFADGLAPPVRRGSFDTVLTPWFIDQVPNDMKSAFDRIWQLLPVGGRWINFGPLIFRQEHTALPHRYCVDEVLELVAAAGFRLERHSFRSMQYLKSPIGSQGRTETVLTFSAE